MSAEDTTTPQHVLLSFLVESRGCDLIRVFNNPWALKIIENPNHDDQMPGSGRTGRSLKRPNLTIPLLYIEILYIQ